MIFTFVIFQQKYKCVKNKRLCEKIYRMGKKLHVYKLNWIYILKIRYKANQLLMNNININDLS
jgi:hypothetical protein